MNRLTITLPDDLYAMARAYAVANRKSISKAIGDLLRQRTGGPPPETRGAPPKDPAGFHIDPATRLPVVPGTGRTITPEDIRRSLDDEDVRHLERMGLKPAEIERALNR